MRIIGPRVHIWLWGKGLVIIAGPCAMNLKASSIWGHKWVRWSSLHNLQGKFTLRLDYFPPLELWVFLSLKLAFFVHVPTLTIIFPLFLIPSGLLVSLLVRRLHWKYTRHLGGLRWSCSLSRGRLVDWQLSNLFYNRICRFHTCTTHNAIGMWSRFDFGVETRMRSVGNNLI